MCKWRPYPELMPHPDTPGVHTYLTHAQARRLLARHTSVEHADRMLDHPNVVSAPMPGRPGERAYRAGDIGYLCRLLADEKAGGGG